MAETWLINESPTLVNLDITINFISNGENYTRFNVSARSSGPRPYGAYGIFFYPGPKQVFEYVDSSWIGQAYRTVTFDTAPTGALLTWLEANAVKQQSKVTCDLSTLDGWSSVPDGDHTLQIVAKASGYRDSEPSEAVTFTKGGVTGETWVINRSPSVGFDNFIADFVCNGDTFAKMYSPLQPDSYITYCYESLHPTPMDVTVYEESRDPMWTDETYRTVYFPEPPTGDLRTWLQNNATLQ